MTYDATKLRRAPVQPSRGVPFPTSVAWHFHDRAWSQYAARFGRSQSAERLAERGGFSAMELVTFLLGRDPMDAVRPTDAEIAAVRAEVEAYDSELTAARADVDRLTRELAEAREAGPSFGVTWQLAAEERERSFLAERARAEKAESENARLREVGASAFHLSMVRATDPELVDLSRAVDRAQKAERERDAAEAARASLAGELAALRAAGEATFGGATGWGGPATEPLRTALADTRAAAEAHDAEVRREALREAEERLRDEVTADAARNVDAIDEDDPVMANFYRVRAEHTARAADKIAALASREHGR